MALNINTSVPDWRWFWGTDEQPTAQEARAILETFDVVITSPDSLLAIQYDHKNGVAMPHIFVAPEARNSGKGLELIQTAERIATADGMRKILAQIPAGNPYFVVGEKNRLGYTLEGELKDHLMISGKPTSLYLYGKLLQQNDPVSKKE